MTAPFPRDLIDAALDVIQAGDHHTHASLFLLDAWSERHMDSHAALHALAVKIAKGAPAEALALALVYERQIGVLYASDPAQAQTDLNNMRVHLTLEVAAWNAFIKVRRYRARLADWKGKMPRPPASPGRKRTARRGIGGDL